LSLPPATRLGPYEILGLLGSGGMGEVYAARDDRLDRRVAVKVLPVHLATDADRLRRFEQEARAASALNHPNILTIHDFGFHDGAPYLVAELLEGETLRERLAGGALPLRKATEVASQIARGLAAAHERGIVHRDLKPENLFLVSDGRVKILDFGLAKLIAPEPGMLADAATEPMATEPGVVLGTVGYMAPEQVRGLPVDARCDLFALGAILYEMISGERAFARASVAETMTAILRDEPAPLDAPGRQVPPALERLVRRCLEKNPAERFRSAHDLAFDLETTTATAAEPAALAPPARSAGKAVRWAAATLAVAIAAVGGWTAGRGSRPEPIPSSPAAASFVPLTDRGGSEMHPVLSPAGDFVIFERRDGGDLDLFLQRVGGHNPTPLTADCPRDDVSAAFSPDGSLVAYRTECGPEGDAIFVMGATGESPRNVIAGGWDPAFSPDGRELVYSTQGGRNPTSRGPRGELWVVRIDTGDRRQIETAVDAVQPTWSPDGRRIAFWGTHGDAAQRDLWTVSADPEGAAPPVAVVEDAALDWQPIWSATGDAVYFASDRSGAPAIWRRRLDPASGAPIGDPEQVLAPPSPLLGGFSLAAGDTKVAVAAVTRSHRIRLAGFDPESSAWTGAASDVHRTSRPLTQVALSPDGTSLVFAAAGAREDLFWLRADGSGLRQLTDDADRQRAPVWAPDGAKILFYSDRRGRYDVWSVRPDGGGLGLEAVSGGSGAMLPIPSPDGRRVAALEAGRGSWLVDRGDRTGATARRLPNTPSGEPFSARVWSADGRQILGIAAGSRKTYLYTLGDGTFAPIALPEPFVLRPSFGPGTLGGVTCSWLPGTPRILCNCATGLMVADTARGTAQTVLAAPEPWTLYSASASLDGRAVAWIEATTEADLWLATFEGKAR
jgi:Tol biopolymer transport system component